MLIVGNSPKVLYALIMAVIYNSSNCWRDEVVEGIIISIMFMLYMMPMAISIMFRVMVMIVMLEMTMTIPMILIMTIIVSIVMTVKFIKMIVFMSITCCCIR